MEYLEIFSEAVQGSIKSILQIATIVIPLMVFIEIFKDLNLLYRLTAILTPLTRCIGLSPEARMPILAGLVFGISYGGGLIIDRAQTGKLSYRDIYIINLFLVICHSVFEDTLLFAAIGAKWIPVLLARLALAILVCCLVGRYTLKKGIATQIPAKY